MRVTPQEAARVLLDWHDEMADPFEQAIPQAQAEETAAQVREIFGMGIEAQKRAFIRRWLESIAQNNAKMLRGMDPEVTS